MELVFYVSGSHIKAIFLFDSSFILMFVGIYMFYVPDGKTVHVTCKTRSSWHE